MERVFFLSQSSNSTRQNTIQLSTGEDMKDPITPEIFAHLVDLAALELEPTQSEYLRLQLNHQLKAISELEAIPLESGLEISAHGVPYTPEISLTPREDIWKAYPNPEVIISQAPATDGGYIVVPEIPHTTLK
jgi:aspartyl-tRNA(Asn)/glutamyl-tRNA(Gln) amidotransferase subunit C